MDHHKLVLPEHINDQNSLFGGYLLKWLDEFAYITANIDFPGHHFVTVAMENVEFKHQINCGQILKFSVNRVRVGKTSVEYAVEVVGARSLGDSDKILFATNITFVNITDSGQKAPIRQ